MINFQNVKFVGSFPKHDLAPNNYNEILFIGKSNVGKSTLINSLCKQKNLAKVSSTPGATKYLNYFNVDDKFYLVDSPGYGFKSDKNFEFTETMDSMLSSKKLKGIVFMLDSRRELVDNDKVFYNMLIDKNIPFFIVLSKEDKLRQQDKVKILKDIHKHFIIVKDEEIVFTSNTNQKSINNLKNLLCNLLK